MDEKYELSYLPLFYEDLENVVLYITEELCNVQAANALIDAVESAIWERLPFAESFEKYTSVKERADTYYRIYVGNYVVYYVVKKMKGRKIMEVRRFLYQGQVRERI